MQKIAFAKNRQDFPVCFSAARLMSVVVLIAGCRRYEYSLQTSSCSFGTEKIVKTAVFLNFLQFLSHRHGGCILFFPTTAWG
jgi:hypothetical protein